MCSEVNYLLNCHDGNSHLRLRVVPSACGTVASVQYVEHSTLNCGGSQFQLQRFRYLSTGHWHTFTQLLLLFEACVHCVISLQLTLMIGRTPPP